MDEDNNKKKVKSKDKTDKYNIINNKYKKNLRRYDLNKLKRVQICKYSIIDELDEEIKSDTIQNNTNKKENNKKSSDKNDNNKKDDHNNSFKKENQIQYEINQINNNKYGLKNNNISIMSNETISNEIGLIDKKLVTSFFSTSTFNCDLVNYKPAEKNSSILLFNNNNMNITNTNFSIINNSSIKTNNFNNNNNTLLASTNNKISKKKDKLIETISDIINLNPEKEDKTNFLIENNSKIINEIDSNNISDIISLENRDLSLDYKINVYNNSKINNDINNKNEITKEISSNDDEGESIIAQFDIINNQRQNESKEIKLSDIKNKETINDNNNISNSNISITNISKFTNFADSNIKFGEMSRLSNKINSINNELKKNNSKMKIIRESENSNNEIKSDKNDANAKRERIEHKKVKKYNNTKKNENENEVPNAFGNNNEENDNDTYFCIKSIEKKENKIKNKSENKHKNGIKAEREPKDTIRNDEPKDNYRNKNNNNGKEFKQKFNSNDVVNKNIFEDEDLNPSKKLVNTNKKDIVNINNKIIINQNEFNTVRIKRIDNNNIKKITLKNDNINNILLNDKQLLCSPSSIKFNNKIIKENKQHIKNENKTQFNNIKRIDKNISKNTTNSTLNENKSRTLKINEIQNLNNFENISNPKKSVNFYHNFYSSPTNINSDDYGEYIINSSEDIEENINIINNKNNFIKINKNNEGNTGNYKKLLEQRNFYFNNDQLQYNNIDSINNSNDNKEIIQYYYQNSQISPRVMNINNIYKINEPYNIYIQ